MREVIIKKDSILYHMSDEPFKLDCSTEEKPMLFCVLHPLEWYYGEEYIISVIIKRDIKLLFMIDNIKGSTLESSLPKMTDAKIHLFKRTHTVEELKYYKKKLIDGGYDGWFNSNAINKCYTDIGLINDREIYEEIRIGIKKDWKRPDCKREIKWGTLYPICSIERPIKFRINEKYKDMIENYVEKAKNIENPRYKYHLPLQIVLKNSEMEYHNGEIKEIIWDIYKFEK